MDYFLRNSSKAKKRLETGSRGLLMTRRPG